MRKLTMKNYLILFLCIFCMVSCQSTRSLEAKGDDRGSAQVKDFNRETNVRVALIEKSALEEAKQNESKLPELTYGAMDVRFLTLDDVTFIVHWDDDQDFNNLKRGEKVNFRSSDYVARVEKTGQNYKVIFLNEL
jgi:hypothetical protein